MSKYLAIKTNKDHYWGQLDNVTDNQILLSSGFNYSQMLETMYNAVKVYVPKYANLMTQINDVMQMDRKAQLENYEGFLESSGFLDKTLHHFKTDESFIKEFLDTIGNPVKVDKKGLVYILDFDVASIGNLRLKDFDN